MRPDLEDTEFDIIDFIEDIDDECECLIFFFNFESSCDFTLSVLK